MAKCKFTSDPEKECDKKCKYYTTCTRRDGWAFADCIKCVSLLDCPMVGKVRGCIAFEEADDEHKQKR